MLIVDSQIHIWKNGRMIAHHRQDATYSYSDAIAEMDAAGVDGAVIHPPGSIGEHMNDYAIEAVRHHPDRFCILGNFDLRRPDRDSIVAHWRERSPGMLGFRFSFSEPHQKSWLTDGTLDGFWKACERHDLRVGLLVSGPTIEAIGRIAERHPGLKMHIDHIGRGGGRAMLRDDAIYADLPQMLALARLANVAVKLSGAPSTSSQAYPYTNIHRYLKQIIDAFGPSRCFWGTDITRMPISWRQCVTMFTEEMPWLKGRDLELVMGAGIVDWLGWKRQRAS